MVPRLTQACVITTAWNWGHSHSADKAMSQRAPDGLLVDRDSRARDARHNDDEALTGWPAGERFRLF